MSGTSKATRMGIRNAVYMRSRANITVDQYFAHRDRGLIRGNPKIDLENLLETQTIKCEVFNDKGARFKLK